MDLSRAQIRMEGSIHDPASAVFSLLHSHWLQLAICYTSKLSREANDLQGSSMIHRERARPQGKSSGGLTTVGSL